MAYIDCFNGDADGLCALTQLRLDTPVESQLITGVKRDISLVQRVDAKQGDTVTVLDVSLDKNRTALHQVLATGATVFYCDHHFSGDVPQNKNLNTLINTRPDVCTSLLIDKHLKGRYRGWAVVGTFGDNLNKSAIGLAKSLNLSTAQLHDLEKLGVYLNYNGYGSQLEDLFFEPAALFQRISQYGTPQAFMSDDVDTFNILEQGYQQDMANAKRLTASVEKPHVAVFMLPDERWARRVSGVFSNDLANHFPERAHAVVTEHANNEYLVSVRAPLNNKQGADEICRQFPTGGGRAAAAGINALPKALLSKFVDRLSDYYV